MLGRKPRQADGAPGPSSWAPPHTEFPLRGRGKICSRARGSQFTVLSGSGLATLFLLTVAGGALTRPRRLHQLRGRKVSVSDLHDPNRPRPRVPGALPLACRRPRYGARLHQTTYSSTQRQGREVASNRQGGVLSTAHLSRRRRSREEAGCLGRLLQLRSTAPRARWKNAIRSAAREATLADNVRFDS